MKSKFRYTAYLTAVGCTLGAFLLIGFFFEYAVKPTTPILLFFIMCAFFVFVFIVFLFGEFRAKIISVEITSDRVCVKRYLGLGGVNVYPIGEITGFNTSDLPSKVKTYEYLYLMVDNRKIAKLSEYYHANYKDLKESIVANNIKNLGFKPFSNREELKDIFSK